MYLPDNFPISIAKKTTTQNTFIGTLYAFFYFALSHNYIDFYLRRSDMVQLKHNPH